MSIIFANVDFFSLFIEITRDFFYFTA